MNTDERVHVYCRNPDIVNNDLGKQKFMPRPIMKDDYYVNTHYIQNQLNDEIKSSSINLSTSYWNNIFESIKLINRYWNKIFNIGINNSPVAWQQDRSILNLK